MDLSKFDTSKASNLGRFLHLEFCGHKLYTETDPKSAIGLTVKGASSTEFRARERSLQKTRLERVRLRKGGKVAGLEGLADEQKELYATAVTSYVNCTLDGVQLTKVSLEETMRLFDRLPWIYDQVVEFVDDDENWVGESPTS